MIVNYVEGEKSVEINKESIPYCFSANLCGTCSNAVCGFKKAIIKGSFGRLINNSSDVRVEVTDLGGQ